MDTRDRLILALASLLKAERETRSLVIEALEDGSITREVLLAMLSDPVPVVTTADLAFSERRADTSVSGRKRQ
ncbi:hypothetical protein G6N76_20195 [Rhizobium daejeonense]|uniref:Uncharacterized protein n=1 Tax=Rhizobium daejeonense TaxID=240521 RepID=A0A6M1S478_9HYPH|nr:hypothetical protein [Rhizobium daejeonense]NGO65989.1 hypothetical protein [Rhizobium daejeonense]